jgi:membrane protein DedA with SNARE-associated domain
MALQPRRRSIRMTTVNHYLAMAEPALREYGYAAAFIGVFLEALGLPLPGETLIITGALLASQGDMNIELLLATVWVAAVLGDNVGYAIGYFGGRRLVVRYGARIGITDTRLSKVEAFFRRYGGRIVLVARFFVLLRQLNGVTAGTVNMSWRRFVLYNALGGALWVLAWGVGVYLLGREISVALVWIGRFGYVLLAVAAGILLVFLVRRFLR